MRTFCTYTQFNFNNFSYLLWTFKIIKFPRIYTLLHPDFILFEKNYVIIQFTIHTINVYSSKLS